MNLCSKKEQKLKIVHQKKFKSVTRTKNFFQEKKNTHLA